MVLYKTRIFNGFKLVWLTIKPTKKKKKKLIEVYAISKEKKYKLMAPNASAIMLIIKSIYKHTLFATYNKFITFYY